MPLDWMNAFELDECLLLLLGLNSGELHLQCLNYNRHLIKLVPCVRLILLYLVSSLSPSPSVSSVFEIRSHCIALTGLEFAVQTRLASIHRDSSHFSASWVLGLKVWIIMPTLAQFKVLQPYKTVISWKLDVETHEPVGHFICGECSLLSYADEMSS